MDHIYIFYISTDILGNMMCNQPVELVVGEVQHSLNTTFDESLDTCSLLLTPEEDQVNRHNN